MRDSRMEETSEAAEDRDGRNSENTQKHEKMAGHTRFGSSIRAGHHGCRLLAIVNNKLLVKQDRQADLCSSGQRTGARRVSEGDTVHRRG